MASLKESLNHAFNRPVSIGKELPEPDYAFNNKRNQYLATTILNRLVKGREYSNYERILGVVDHDLFVPELNFVFGLAGERAAVIALPRLRQSFYGLPEENTTFQRRVLIEAVHELGHTYGLGHCRNPRCVMFFSNSLSDTDRKEPDLCESCKERVFI
ncbi:MAG: archaemetzincin family Zn-dependent metalloprotease [Proteobacteria bacterium]|nr:archaemetzincin family Zn-dependent metalloprotease [Pseudomonadota bacterium]